MRLTASGLNRATLARQLLLRREPLGVVDAVRRVVALTKKRMETVDDARRSRPSGVRRWAGDRTIARGSASACPRSMNSRGMNRAGMDDFGG